MGQFTAVEPGAAERNRCCPGRSRSSNFDCPIAPPIRYVTTNLRHWPDFPEAVASKRPHRVDEVKQSPPSACICIVRPAAAPCSLSKIRLSSHRRHGPGPLSSARRFRFARHRRRACPRAVRRRCDAVRRPGRPSPSCGIVRSRTGGTGWPRSKAPGPSRSGIGRAAAGPSPAAVAGPRRRTARGRIRRRARSAGVSDRDRRP